MPRLASFRRRRAKTALGVAALLGFVVASSLDAHSRPHPRQEQPMPMMVCEPPSPPGVSPGRASFGPHGGQWGTWPPVDATEASCEWVAGEDLRQPASLVHYPAHEQQRAATGYVGWTWVGSEQALDPSHEWALHCEWRPADCTPETCPEPKRVEIPARPIVEVQDLGLDLSLTATLERHSCDGVLRLRLRAEPEIPWALWADGGVVRVGYADGSWALAGPAQNPRLPGQLGRVPAPEAGDAWVGVELVAGDGRVLHSQRFELDAAFFDEVEVVDDYGGGRAYEQQYREDHAMPRSRGCRRN